MNKEEEMKEKLENLSKEERVNILILANGETIGDFYTDGFEIEEMEGYWEIILDNKINTIYVDKGKFSDIDVHLGMIIIDY